MWGRRVRIRPDAETVGNTPTHVGKTLNSWIQPSRFKKHPHACGEDTRPIAVPPTSEETPPRMWGRRSGVAPASAHDGNTPTHVGKTKARDSRHKRQRKHPHACGEDFGPGGPHPPTWETPPRMWGRPIGESNSAGNERNTPTHVGKTGGAQDGRQKTKKHPHACGEDKSTKPTSAPALETPPRMWGRLAIPFVILKLSRNTPTHVGKTSGYPSSFLTGRKHPHACGEDVNRSERKGPREETPPRMWGRLLSTGSITDAERNTPTHVGKTPTNC